LLSVPETEGPLQEVSLQLDRKSPPQKAASTGTRVRKECCDERTEAVAGDLGSGYLVARGVGCLRRGSGGAIEAVAAAQDGIHGGSTGRCGARATPFRPGALAARTAARGLAVLPLLISESIAVVPDGSAGVRLSQIWGVRPGTLYPGVHLVTPLIDSVGAVRHAGANVFDCCDFAGETGKRPADRAGARRVGDWRCGERAVPARSFEADRDSFEFAATGGQEVVAPVVSTIYRQLARITRRVKFLR